jgi:hypothetical protein
MIARSVRYLFGLPPEASLFPAEQKKMNGAGIFVLISAVPAKAQPSGTGLAL